MTKRTGALLVGRAWRHFRREGAQHELRHNKNDLFGYVLSPSSALNNTTLFRLLAAFSLLVLLTARRGAGFKLKGEGEDGGMPKLSQGLRIFLEPQQHRGQSLLVLRAAPKEINTPLPTRKRFSSILGPDLSVSKQPGGERTSPPQKSQTSGGAGGGGRGGSHSAGGCSRTVCLKYSTV